MSKISQNQMLYLLLLLFPVMVLLLRLDLLHPLVLFSSFLCLLFPIGPTTRVSLEWRLKSRLQMIIPCNSLSIIFYSYHASEDSEISFRHGDGIRQVKPLAYGWCVGTLKGGRRGLFPCEWLDVRFGSCLFSQPLRPGSTCKVLPNM